MMFFSTDAKLRPSTLNMGIANVFLVEFNQDVGELCANLYERYYVKHVFLLP